MRRVSLNRKRQTARILKVSFHYFELGRGVADRHSLLL